MTFHWSGFVSWVFAKHSLTSAFKFIYLTPYLSDNFFSSDMAYLRCFWTCFWSAFCETAWGIRPFFKIYQVWIPISSRRCHQWSILCISITQGYESIQWILVAVRKFWTTFELDEFWIFCWQVCRSLSLISCISRYPSFISAFCCIGITWRLQSLIAVFSVFDCLFDEKLLNRVENVIRQNSVLNLEMWVAKSHKFSLSVPGWRHSTQYLFVMPS